MFPNTTTAADDVLRNRSNVNRPVAAEVPDTSTGLSAVSWTAIFAGAAAAAALSLILLVLGAGLGLSAVSPWSQAGIAATTFGVSTILWITLTQILASGMGGYLAGRLRTRWLSVQRDEVYFRDTAHGFLSWAVATLVTAAVLTSAVSSIAGGTVQAGASMVGGVASATTGAAAMVGAQSTASDSSGPLSYLTDRLFRKDPSTGTNTSATSTATATAAVGTDSSNSTSTAEVTRILMNSMASGALPAEDVQYLGQVVAQRTGLTQADAEKRVNDMFTRAQAQLRDAQTAAKQAADTARKTSAYAALWLFVSLLTGAFVASWAATFGGRQRDY
jgi:hypothetical protein